MSGETIKLVKVEEVELRQLQNRKSRVCANNPDVHKQIEAAQKKAKQEFQQQLGVLAQRTQRREQQTTQFKSSLANVEKNNTARLQQVQLQLQTALNQVESRQQQQQNLPKGNTNNGFAELRSQHQKNTELAREEYNRILQAQAQQFNQIVTQERHERQQQLQLINEQKQQHQKLAEDLLADVQTIWLDINQNYQHLRFAPGRIAALDRQIEFIRANIQVGVFEAAIANAQQTYLSLSDLRLELEQKEQESLIIYNAALEELRGAIAQTTAHHKCQVEIGDSTVTELFDLDVNYWSHGKLSQYEQQLQQLESQLVAKRDTLTKEQVQHIIQQIAALQPQLTEIVEQARLNMLSSQMRAEIADTVVAALSNLGYTLVNSEDAVYEGEDQRQAYVVKVKNLAGDEVVTVINPEKEFGTNSISINAFSESLIDQTAAQQNAKAVFDVLETAGIQGIGEMQCNHQPRPEYHNLEQVKQRRQGTSRQ
ncbi:MAG: hypothetical protein DSM106950_27445 [Stigonema ocellatum SAG 48.90 = DSM 106950]|nr:hypothetical protein [Stigonema ocellatum SAG 48.90 = DSM 106950]